MWVETKICETDTTELDSRLPSVLDIDTDKIEYRVELIYI